MDRVRAAGMTDNDSDVNIRSVYDRISEGSPTAELPILDHKKDDSFFDNLQMKSKEFVVNKGKGKFQKV